LEETGVFTRTTYLKDSVTTEAQGENNSDNSRQTIDSKHIEMQHGNSKVLIKQDGVYLGGDDDTDDAVLGVELANILSELMGYLGQMMTSTMMGPQPPANISSLISLKAKIDSFKSSHSGFLTQKVQIKK
jgi:hypothetical protein